jgi:hypothetical protein
MNNFKKNSLSACPALNQLPGNFTAFPTAGTNICNHFKIRKGDSGKRFAESDYVLEETYEVPRNHHVPLETYSVIAQFEKEGKLEVARALDTTHVMNPSVVAKAIVNGIAHRRYIIIPGNEGRMLFWFSGISSSALYWVMDRLVDKALKTTKRREN